jgi:hypothetical protein
VAARDLAADLNDSRRRRKDDQFARSRSVGAWAASSSSELIVALARTSVYLGY